MICDRRMMHGVGGGGGGIFLMDKTQFGDTL